MAGRYGVDRGEIREIGNHEVDYELDSPEQLYGSHINLIPIQSAVHPPRLFYGARFFNQAMPLQNPEAPLVQNLMADGSGRSFDEKLGEFAGAVRAPEDAEITEVAPTHITARGASGKEYKSHLYQNLAFNRKTGISSVPTVQVGSQVKKGDLMAHSNYTDKHGTLAMGLNARVGIVPYKGWSMDDAIVVSEPFARRLTSHHLETYEQEYDGDIKGGVDHYSALFPHKYTKDQLGLLDKHGVVRPGTVLRRGDPLFLATRPKAVTSQALGKLSRVMQQTRQDASQVWGEDEEGIVTDVAKTKDGWKAVVQSYRPTRVGDKITGRAGAKSIVSRILPEDRMPRTSDGHPLEVLMNPLSIPSRINSSLIYEMLLGKVAAKTGKTVKLPGFTPSGQDWWTTVKKAMDENGVTDKDQVFDPTTNKLLESPITTGVLHISKLHHIASSKLSGRGVGSYDANLQPSKGSGEGAQAKRQSGLEVAALRAAGAYSTLRENATLRGQKNDTFWRDIRSGQSPRPPGVPFVYDKFQALLTGSGALARNLKGGQIQLGPMTDKELERLDAVELKNGDLVDPSTLEPSAGGLFDPALVQANRYGKISLPERLPNPAMESNIIKLLGVTRKEYREILAGRMELPHHLR